MLSPIYRPNASSGMERMGPPGSRQQGTITDRVELGTSRSEEPPVLSGLRGWRKGAVLGLGLLSLAGGLAILGPQVGPALVASQQTPEQQLLEMIGRGQLQPTAQERRLLLESLKPVDPQVLSLLNRHGLSVNVLHPGQDLADAGVLRQQPFSKYQAKAGEIREFMSGLQNHVRHQYDGRLNQMEQERDRVAERLGMPTLPNGLSGMYPMGLGSGFAGAAPQLTPDQEKLRDLNLEIGKLTAEKNGYIFTQALQSDLGLKPFSYPVVSRPSVPSGPFGMPGADFAPMLLVQSQMPHSLEAMAKAHGAQTPEQLQEFYKLMELINGDRLKEAQKAGAEQMAEMAKVQGTEQSVLSATLKYPEKIPMDHRAFNLLVPNMYYTRVGERVMPLDEHDWGTVQRWTEEGTRRINTGLDETGQPDGQMGQFFHLGDVNAVAIRDFQVGATVPLHEFGHALDYLVQKLDPAWHETWWERVARGFDQVGLEGGPQPISRYSRTNVTEYIGDGFMLYHTDPKTLQARDGELFLRMEELIGKARELSNPLASQQHHATLDKILRQIRR